jgi:hypothetical protein
MQCLYSFFYLFLCFLKFFVFVVLALLECLLYILVDHIQYPPYNIFIYYLQDLFLQIVLVGLIGFFGIVYLILLESNHPALELGFCCACLLGVCFFASCPYSRQGQRSISLLSVTRMFCWFADCFSTLQHCLTLDVAHWLWR